MPYKIGTADPSELHATQGSKWDNSELHDPIVNAYNTQTPFAIEGVKPDDVDAITKEIHAVSALNDVSSRVVYHLAENGKTGRIVVGVKDRVKRPRKPKTDTE